MRILTILLLAMAVLRGAEATPTATVEHFIAAVAARDQASITACFHLPNETARREVERDLQGWIERGLSGRIVEEKLDGDAAVVVLLEKPGDADPALLLRVGDAWKILPGITRTKRAGLEAATEARFAGLVAWFTENKPRFKAMGAGNP